MMSASHAPATGTVAVDGGELSFDVTGGSSAPVVCIHGISSQRKLWLWLEAEAPDLRLVAPDLRGRGDSFGVGGPSSIARHVEDVVAVMDALGLDRATVCGMSMGGFVAIEMAARYPERVSSLVLVDGGFPMAFPPGLTEGNVQAVFADRFGRLERRWASVSEYKEYFLAETAPLLDPADPLLDRYLAHDLSDGQVRLSGEAVASDARDIFFGPNRWDDLTVPVNFLYAEWSKGADSPPAYPAEAMDRYRKAARSVTGVTGVDHAGIIMSRTGAAAVAPVIRAAL